MLTTFHKLDVWDEQMWRNRKKVQHCCAFSSASFCCDQDHSIVETMATSMQEETMSIFAKWKTLSTRSKGNPDALVKRNSFLWG